MGQMGSYSLDCYDYRTHAVLKVGHEEKLIRTENMKSTNMTTNTNIKNTQKTYPRTYSICQSRTWDNNISPCQCFSPETRFDITLGLDESFIFDPINYGMTLYMDDDHEDDENRFQGWLICFYKKWTYCKLVSLSVVLPLQVFPSLLPRSLSSCNS